MRKEVKIGIYAVVILLCAWAGIRFLSGVDVFGRHATYYARYEQVNGVQSAAPVMLRGVKIGQVSDIRVSPDDPTSVEVILSIPRAYALPSDSEARIVSTSIMGGKAIDIVFGSSPEVLKSGDMIASSYEADLLSVAGEELLGLKDKIVALADNLNTTLNNLNLLVESNGTAITEAVNHLNSITAGLDAAVGGESQRLTGIMANIDTFATTLGNNSSRMDSILADVDSLTSSLADNGTGKTLAQSLNELNALLAKVNSGDGTVGQLLGDEQLYNNLTQASDNLSILLADLKSHPKRYVHFSLFGNKDDVDKKAAKAAKKAAKAEKKISKSEN